MVRVFMCWHVRLSRLNSVSDVAGRDHVVAQPEKGKMTTTMASHAVDDGLTVLEAMVRATTPLR